MEAEAFLLELGFEEAGEWRLESGQSKCILHCHRGKSGILYAFVVQDRVMYLGKSIHSLSRRMYGYERPGPTQNTNIKNHANIKALLLSGDRVRILAFAPVEKLLYRGVEVNLAAGLEDALIARLQPLWNYRGATASTT